MNNGKYELCLRRTDKPGGLQFPDGFTRAQRLLFRLQAEEAEERLTAAHEAAHVVAAHVLGIGVDFVTVRPVSPKIWYRIPPSRSAEKYAENQRALAVAHWAGACAEVRQISLMGLADPGSRINVIDLASSLDLEGINEICQAHAGDNRHKGKRLGERLRRQAKALVRRHWPAIEALAHELTGRRTMSGDEVREFLAGLEPAA